MQKSYVLITGASGFIGSYLVPYLLARDYGVIGLSRQKKFFRSSESHLDSAFR